MRTLFVSVSMIGVFRNLFFFPGSFFFLLRDEARRGRVRVVFLLHARDIAKYRPFFTEHWGREVMMEGIDLPRDRSFTQKAFRFFYAYLVYTQTTKILTTMGMRVEEPPAGNRRALAPLRWLIARTAGRSRFVKNTLVPALYHRLFTARPFAAVCRRYRPALIFAPNLYGQFDTELVAEARRQGIPSIGMLANWDHVDKYFLPIKTDTLLVTSEPVKQAAVRYQAYEPGRVVPVGYPYHDVFLHKQFTLPGEKLLRDIGLPAHARYILYVSGSSYCPDEPEVLEEMLSWIAAGVFGPDVYLVVRPYVGGRGKDRAFDEKKFFALKHHPRAVFFERQVWDSLENSVLYINIMRFASVVMTVYSTAFLESAVMDRPLVAASFDGRARRPRSRSIRRFEGFEHFKLMLETGSIKRTLNFAELKNALREYLENPALDREKRALVCRELCYRLDGENSQRVLEAVLSRLSEGT